MADFRYLDPSIDNEKLLKNCLKRFFSLLYETMDFFQPVEQAILIEITNRTLYKKKQNPTMITFFNHVLFL